MAARLLRPTLLTAAGSLAVCALLAGYAASVAEGATGPVATLGAGAVFTLALSLVMRWTTGIAWALLLLAVEYAAALAARGSAEVDPGAPLFGGGLLVVAELAYWSLELRGPGYEERRVVARRLAALALLALLSMLLGALVVVVTAAPLGGGLAWDAIGVAAAGATLGVVAWLAHRAAA